MEGGGKNREDEEINNERKDRCSEWDSGKWEDDRGEWGWKNRRGDGRYGDGIWGRNRGRNRDDDVEDWEKDSNEGDGVKKGDKDIRDRENNKNMDWIRKGLKDWSWSNDDII